MPSENGWEPSRIDPNSPLLVWRTVPGTNVSLQVRDDDAGRIMLAFAADYHANVEPLRDADSACYTPTNSVATSNHLNSTGMDLNWNSHPFRVRGTFTPAQMVQIRKLLAFYDGMIFWAGDWTDPIDEMHWQMDYGSWNNPAVANFVKTKIRADGFSTYQRETTIPASEDAAKVLAQLMGNQLSLDRYRELLPAFSACLIACECNNVNRIAMAGAQLGHESLGLYYSEEIASGARYEGRSDLGNTQPGDGVRFKGRSWIQVTGRHNYTALSKWAFGKGLVPTPTYFVDNPTELASDQYAGLGAAWYWVVARPDINELSDKRDLITVTQRINGGQNGIDDRRTRYQRALGMGDALLTLTTAGDDMFTDDDRNLLKQIAEIRRKSRSPLRWPGEGEVDTIAGFAWSTDANVHVLLVERLAVEYGDTQAISLLYAVATTTLADRQEDAKLARRILKKVPADKVGAAGANIAAYVDTLAA